MSGVDNPFGSPTLTYNPNLGVLTMGSAGFDGHIKSPASIQVEPDVHLYLSSGTAGNFYIRTNASEERIAITTVGNITINDSGSDADLRIEGVGDTNLLFIDSSTNSVGIGEASPQAKLHVNGGILITGGNPGVGKVLTSDASGSASWQDIPGPSGASGTFTTNDAQTVVVTNGLVTSIT